MFWPLLNLDGDRTAFGFPDGFPFNCTGMTGAVRCAVLERVVVEIEVRR